MIVEEIGSELRTIRSQRVYMRGREADEPN